LAARNLSSLLHFFRGPAKFTRHFAGRACPAGAATPFLFPFLPITGYILHELLGAQSAMARETTKEANKPNNGANLGFEQTLWQAAAKNSCPDYGSVFDGD
jgi:hypothetical protein